MLVLQGCSRLNSPACGMSSLTNLGAFQGQLLAHKLAPIPCPALCTALVPTTATWWGEEYALTGAQCRGRPGWCVEVGCT